MSGPRASPWPWHTIALFKPAQDQSCWTPGDDHGPSAHRACDLEWTTGVSEQPRRQQGTSCRAIPSRYEQSMDSLGLDLSTNAQLLLRTLAVTGRAVRLAGLTGGWPTSRPVGTACGRVGGAALPPPRGARSRGGWPCGLLPRGARRPSASLSDLAPHNPRRMASRGGNAHRSLDPARVSGGAHSQAAFGSTGAPVAWMGLSIAPREGETLMATMTKLRSATRCWRSPGRRPRRTSARA